MPKKKITFLHYFFRNDGVTNVVLNNLRGLQQIDENYTFSLAGSHFAHNLPSDVEKHRIGLDDPERDVDGMVCDFESIAEDSSIFIVENPIVGLYPNTMKAFKKFTEKNKDFPVIFRVHDLDYEVDVNPSDKNYSAEDRDAFARTDNAHYFTPISLTSERLKKKASIEATVIENSIRTEDFVMDEKRKQLSEDFRNDLQSEGFLNSDERIITYPVRVSPPKNVEEALLATKLLNMDGGNYKLLVTLFNHEDYKKNMKDLSKKFDIPASIGEIHRMIDHNDKGYKISNLFDISDAAITTSVYEGFGYAFIEPWLSGTPLIGRDLKGTTRDFKSKGLDFGSLYDGDDLKVFSTSAERTDFVRNMLSDRSSLYRLKDTLCLDERLLYAREHLNLNRSVARDYDYIPVAKKLDGLIKKYV